MEGYPSVEYPYADGFRSDPYLFGDPSMLLLLEGGPFDGRVVEPARNGVELPQSLGFGSTGDSVSILASSPAECFTDWRLRDPQVPPELAGRPRYYTATYHRTQRTTPDGMTVFGFDRETGVS